MHWAAMGGHSGIVRMLMEKGADPFLSNKQVRSPSSVDVHVVVVTFLTKAHHGKTGWFLKVLCVGWFLLRVIVYCTRQRS